MHSRPAIDGDQVSTAERRRWPAGRAQLGGASRPNRENFVRRNMDNYVVGTNDKFTLNIVVHNYGEDAYESMLYLEIPEDINLVHVKTVSGESVKRER